MADLETRLRTAMESAVASEQPPGNLVELVRRRHRRYMARATVAGAAAVAVVAVLIPAGTRLLGHLAGPAGGQRPALTVYAGFEDRLTGTVIPISAATNRPGKPIHIGGSLAVSPNGKTLYISTGAWTVPISTASNKPGQRINVSGYLTIDPNGKLAYATGLIGSNTVVPVNLATGKPGKPIHVCGSGEIAFTPDGKTAYVSCPSPGHEHGHSDQHGHRHAGPADPRRRRWPGNRDHPGREDRLRPGRAHGDPDQYGHQHAGQADPPRVKPHRPDRDQPGREDGLRRRHRHGYPDQHGHQHARPADPHRRRCPRRANGVHPGREDGLRGQCRGALRQSGPDQHGHQ